MEKSVYIGNCPICRGYGMLEVVVNPLDLNYFVMCDECHAEWKNPEEAYKNVNGRRMPFSGVKVRNATMDEINEIGWDKYVIE